MRHCSAIAVASLLASTALAEPAWRTPGEEEASAARHLARAGRCADALEPFDRAVEARAEDASVRRDRGLCHESLGHPAPAIEDYRAYLSMAGAAAPDSGPIRARLEALQAAEHADHRASSAPPATAAAPATAPSSATALSPAAAPSPPAQASARTRSDPSARDERGFLLGFRLADRAWDASGYGVLTTSYGILLGYSFARAWEADARLVGLSTNVDHTGGIGLSLGGTWTVGLDAARVLELGLGLGAGFESQKNDAGTARPLWLVQMSPTLRVLPLPALVLAVGPELGTGSIRVAGASSVDRPDSSAHTVFYGAAIEIAWLLGRGNQSE